jgi:hypothetical protein
MFIWEWNLIVMFVANSLQQRVISPTISIQFILIFESRNVHCVKSRSPKLVVSKHTLNQFTTKHDSSVLWQDVTNHTPRQPIYNNTSKVFMKPSYNVSNVANRFRENTICNDIYKRFIPTNSDLLVRLRVVKRCLHNVVVSQHTWNQFTRECVILVRFATNRSLIAAIWKLILHRFTKRFVINVRLCKNRKIFQK